MTDTLTEHVTCYLCPAAGAGVFKRKIAGKPHMLCAACFKISNRAFPKKRGKRKHRRVEAPSRLEWVEALKRAKSGGKFHCGISGVALDTISPGSPLYATLDHVNPSRGNGGWMVVAAVINDMKSDLSTEEFRSVVSALATIFSSEDINARQSLERKLSSLEFWKRS